VELVKIECREHVAVEFNECDTDQYGSLLVTTAYNKKLFSDKMSILQ
jgi:hypothetical protein